MVLRTLPLLQEPSHRWNPFHLKTRNDRSSTLSTLIGSLLSTAPDLDSLASDASFDAFYDESIRLRSPQHWTPVRVAARAAQLLVQEGATRILDIGSGVGKFCIVGALSTAATFVGVERRHRLVEVARRAAVNHGAERATFVHANMDSLPFDGFNGIYLYNPFYEQICSLLVPIDSDNDRSPSLYRHYVETTTRKLEKLAPPVALVTFNGFGGCVPASFTFLGDEPAGIDQLEL